MEQLASYIHGEARHDAQGETFEIENPATAKIIAQAKSASSTVIEDAVSSALVGQKAWAALSSEQRGQSLVRLADLLQENTKQLAFIEVEDTGKPIQEALNVDVDSAQACLRYFAGMTDKIQGTHQELQNAFFYTRREPLGVCLGIGAWNYPLQIACWKMAPALAAGNSLIFKPSELTPRSSLKLAELAIEAGIPPGVFNIILGGGDIAKQVMMQSDIAKVSFTGSVETGKKVMAQASQQIQQVTMELGGKSPLIIFDDACLDSSVAGAILANFYTQGEVCSNGTRVFIHESMHDAFVDKVQEVIESIKIGNPLNPETQMGAIISQSHLAKIQSYIHAAQAAGAKKVYGGEPITVADHNGYFMRPCLFTACQDDMQIVQEEVFGPLMSVLSFRDEDEVIARANKTPYGLAAGLFTKNLSRAHRVIAQLQAGTCWINTYNITPIAMPFGGVKQSGIGRENGLEVLNHYTQTKSVYVELENIQSPY